MLELYHLYQQ